jgi:CheY-like chemotaxis protein
MHMPKILVVDDEEDQEELIMQRFAHKDYLRDYTFIFARDGVQGLQLVNENPDIELVLLDINMPEMDGLTLLEKIQEINPTVRSVMLSAYGDMTNIRSAMNRGAYDFLIKPIDMADLGITIKKTLGEVKRLKENLRTQHENLELRQRAAELKTQVLRTQMNPHFIFNSLNSINRFILQNNREQAAQYLTKFSKLIRLILQNSQAPLITLESELESLQLYLELEALRFEHRFDYEIVIPEDLDVSAISVPPLMIQPFAENAIWHGLMHKEEKGRLQIKISQDDDVMIFSITDDGIGRKKAAELDSKSATRHKSMGLRITSERIEMLWQAGGNISPVAVNDLVDADGNAAGTEVIIKIPVLYDKSDIGG